MKNFRPLESEAALTELKRARIAMLSTQPFFGALSLKLQLQSYDPSGPHRSKTVMSTDGTVLRYNPAQVTEARFEHLTSLIAMHTASCASGQPWRRRGRDEALWKRACEYAITPIVKDAGFELPPGALYEDRFRDHSAEQVYRLLRHEQEKPGQQPQPQPQPGVSDVQDAPQPSEGEGDDEDEGGSPGDKPEDSGDNPTPGNEPDTQTEHSWQIAALQSEMASKKRGSMPSGAERMLNQIRNPSADWRAILQQFVREAAKSDYTWSSPSRRYLPLGLYLPSLHSQKLGTIAVAIDTSGSIGQAELNAFAAELQGIIEDAEPEKVVVLYADAAVQHVQTFEKGGGDEFKLELRGGGGTDFRPVFTYLEDYEIEPVCTVYLTDLLGVFGEEPEHPVLWCVSGRIPEQPPFGEAIEIEAVV